MTEKEKRMFTDRQLLETIVAHTMASMYCISMMQYSGKETGKIMDKLADIKNFINDLLIH